MEAKKLENQDFETLKELAKECQEHINRLTDLKKKIQIQLILRRKQKILLDLQNLNNQ